GALVRARASAGSAALPTTAGSRSVAAAGRGSAGLLVRTRQDSLNPRESSLDACILTDLRAALGQLVVILWTPPVVSGDDVDARCSPSPLGTPAAPPPRIAAIAQGSPNEAVGVAMIPDLRSRGKAARTDEE